MKLRPASIIHIILLILLATLPFWANSAIFFLKDPPVFPDEVTFSTLARNLSEEGITATNILGGILPEADKGWLGYKYSIYFHLLGTWGRVFGFNIDSIRSLSLLLGFLSLIVFFLISRMLFYSNRLAVLGTFLLSIDVIFGRASRLGRMEILTLLELLISLYLMLLAFKQQRRFPLVISGIFAALASATHPIGSITLLILAASTIAHPNLQILNQLKRKTVNLLLITTTIISTYLLWILVNGGNISALLSTFLDHVQDKTTSKLPFAWLLFNSDLSWRLLFLVYITILVIFILLIFKFKENKYTPIFLGLIFGAGASIIGKESGYMLYFEPFIILALISLITFYYSHKLSLLKTPLIFLVIFFIIFHLDIQFLNNNNLAINNREISSLENILNDNYQQFSEEILNALPPQEKTSIFISAVPDPYFILKDRENLTLYETVDPSYPIPEASYKKLLDKTDYLVITWFPHQYLADYAKRNTESTVKVSQKNGYWAMIIKLKPRANRI